MIGHSINRYTDAKRQGVEAAPRLMTGPLWRRRRRGGKTSCFSFMSLLTCDLEDLCLKHVIRATLETFTMKFSVSGGDATNSQILFQPHRIALDVRTDGRTVGDMTQFVRFPPSMYQRY